MRAGSSGALVANETAARAVGAVVGPIEGEVRGNTKARECRSQASGSEQRALRHAALEPGQIDYVNTHGTSTPRGDLGEIRALRKVFGDRRIPYSSTKGYTGHTISAAGAIEAIFTLMMLRGGWIAPSAHADPLDPELAGDPPVLRPTSAPLRFALSNSLGFGATNVALVLENPFIT